MLKFLREGLRRPLTEPRPPATPEFAALASSLNETAQRRLGHSLSIRQIDAGSCNGCELEIHALNNAFYDIERFGIRFVASPRHADVLLVTGPVTRNMRQALELTWRATPDPKWVVAVGDCGADGGIFAASSAVVGGVSSVVPVDLTIRGCPPSPTQLLTGLLSLFKQPS
jgi:Ni,Fe-hydrogenase III small subunit